MAIHIRIQGTVSTMAFVNGKSEVGSLKGDGGTWRGTIMSPWKFSPGFACEDTLIIISEGLLEARMASEW